MKKCIVYFNDWEMISAHKHVLASASTYFAAIFNENFKEGKQESIHIKDIDSDTLKSLISYMYSFKLDVNESNVKKLLNASCYFNLDFAKELCSDFIKHHLNPTNCLMFMEYANFILDYDLYNYCFLYILKNFTTIMESETISKTFYELNYDTFVKFLSSDHLEVKTEFEVFEYITNWIEFDKLHRMESLPNLLTHLRLASISNIDLKKIVSASLIEENCTTLINFHREIFKVKLFSDHPREMHRIPFDWTELDIIIVVFEPENESFTNEFLFTDALTLNWKLSTKALFTAKRSESQIVSIKNRFLLSIGGRDDKWNLVNSVDIFDFMSLKLNWESTSPMKIGRKNFAVCSYGKCVYIVGGTDNHGIELNTIEYYDIINREWNLIAERMTFPRYSCAAVYYKECLYVFGGQDSTKMYNCVEIYDFKKKCWSQIEPIPKGMALTSMNTTILNNIVYFIGGCQNEKDEDDLNEVSNGVFKFDLQSHIWTQMPNLNWERKRTNAVFIKNDLFVFGGYDKYDDVVPISERFCSEKNEWKVIESADIDYCVENAIYLNSKQLKHLLEVNNIKNYFGK
ncbi:kelch-like protein diablo isoform X2 [Daktulosphaira vitifoliae]|uniref:kelch-like protein diablo isoform X2 n=1 Tax=Daktulosphaira vitifoliae TaxID=58002 RepID=UPI0021AA2DAD|nr:kelch-like protein diablo isoform X2 [Daktulosphaira vitifoliae]